MQLYKNKLFPKIRRYCQYLSQVNQNELICFISYLPFPVSDMSATVRSNTFLLHHPSRIRNSEAQLRAFLHSNPDTTKFEQNTTKKRKSGSFSHFPSQAENHFLAPPDLYIERKKKTIPRSIKKKSKQCFKLMECNHNRNWYVNKRWRMLMGRVTGYKTIMRSIERDEWEFRMNLSLFLNRPWGYWQWIE